MRGAKELVDDPLYVAIVSRLQSEGHTIYDSVPADADPPYTAVVSLGSSNFSCKMHHGADSDVVLRTSSAHINKREALREAGNVVRSLTETPLAIGGHTLLQLTARGTNAYPEPDPKAARVRQHVAITLRVLTRQQS